MSIYDETVAQEGEADHVFPGNDGSVTTYGGWSGELTVAPPSGANSTLDTLDILNKTFGAVGYGLAFSLLAAPTFNGSAFRKINVLGFAVASGSAICTELTRKITNAPRNFRYGFDMVLAGAGMLFPMMSIGKSLELIKTSEAIDAIGDIVTAFSRPFGLIMPWTSLGNTGVSNTITGSGEYVDLRSPGGGSVNINFSGGTRFAVNEDFNSGFLIANLIWGDGDSVTVEQWSDGRYRWSVRTAAGDYIQIEDGKVYSNSPYYQWIKEHYLNPFVESPENYSMGSEPGNLSLSGSDNINGTGNNLDNVLAGNSGENVLNGGAGNDFIDGGLGEDTLIGGDGDDIFVVDNGGDAVYENPDNGNDTVISSVSYTLPTNFENLILTGEANFSGLGNDLDNVIIGNAGDNTLSGGAGNDYIDGGAGADTMIGGTGNDTFVVDNSGDVVVENPDEGIDVVLSSINYTLSPNIENLILTGEENISGTGNDLDNVIIGNIGDNTLVGGAGNDYIDGGAGADFMSGGIGNDTYVVDNSGDVVVENPDEGVDTVASSISYTLSPNIENLMLTGEENISGTGNDLDNVIVGSVGDNTLSSGAGNDYIDGGAGADVMIGGIGNDAYVIDNSGDVVVENPDEGVDTVVSSISYTLSSNIENLMLTGDDNINAIGNELDNAILGNNGNNVFDGGIGDDYIFGDDGNDVIYGNNGNDILDGGSNDDYLNGGVGDDTFLWSSGSGNDTIDNYTSGGQGQDTIQFGDELTENSFAYLATGTDLVLLNESTGETLKVIGWFNGQDYEIANFQFADNTAYSGDKIESRAITVGPIIVGTAGSDNISAANGCDNTIFGVGGNDNLYAGNGNDLLDGGTGNDFLYGGTGNETFLWGAGSGNDTIDAGFSGAHGQFTVRFGTGLTVGSLTYSISGSSLVIANIETGETLTISGWFNNTNNEIQTFQFADGTSYTGQEIADRAVTYGTANGDSIFAIDGRNNTIYGLDGNDLLFAGNGNDVLDGGLGNDLLYGGTGNDTFIWGQGWGNDEIDAGFAGTHGYDTIRLGIGLTIDALDYQVSGSDLVMKNKTTEETLTLSNWFTNANYQIQTFQFADGTSYTGQEIDDRAVTYGTTGTDYKYAINDRNNTIYGLDGDDYLYAGNGNDVLDGGSGNDFLYGGTGNDTFIWSQGWGNDKINAGFAGAHGQDTVKLGMGLTIDSFDYQVNGSDLVMKNKTTGETLTLLKWFTGVNYQVQTFEFTDEISFAGRQIADRAITYGTAGADNIYGFSGRNNTIYGLAGNDYIFAGNGNDLLDGGTGNDFLFGGIGSCTFIWGQGWGNDKINAGYAGVHDQDTIQFQNLALAAIQFTRSYNDLVCTFGQTGETVTIAKWYLGTSYQINQFQFTDGTLTAAEVSSRVQ